MIDEDHCAPGPCPCGLGIQLVRERAWIGPLIIWNLNIAPIVGPDRSESAYSLLRPDGSLRPAYRQVRSARE